MKQLLILIISLWLFSGVSLAQTSETFDIATFKSPKGWTKKSGNDAVQISTEDGANAFCLITLFKSIPGLNDSKENFDAAWQSIVKELVTVTDAPQMNEIATKDDWEIQSGFAEFNNDGNKGAAVLVTASGYGKMVNVLILTNTQSYEKNIADFLESITLKKLTATPKQPAENTTTDSAIVGQWGISVSPQDSYSVNNGINGYTTREYTFKPDGTYLFLTKLFSYLPNMLLFTKETGTYQVSENTITLNPQKGFIQEWSKKTVTASDGRQTQTDDWGKVLSTQKWTLEKTTYQFTKNYLSGTEKWQLILRSDKTTKRDGPFNGGSSFPNSWFYETVRFPIKEPK